MDRHKQAVLARHIVSGRRDRAERRTPQHEFASTEAHQISEVRVSPGKLFDLDASAAERRVWKQLGQMVSQITFKRVQIEFFTGANRRGVIVVRSCFW